MACYQEMASVYEHIFPLSAEKIRCIESCLRETPSRILDIGCATGQLAMHLASKSQQVTGIDLDREMIARARKESADVHNGARFFVMDMNDIGNSFAEHSFDLVVCTGNTLVHLPDTAAIRAFLTEVSRILKRDGSALIQILNYEKILSERPNTLPVIDNEFLTFSRYYSYETLPESITFTSELHIKSTKAVSRSSVRLHPLRPDDLTAELKRSGFHSVRIFSGFSGSHFTPASDNCILIASAPGELSNLT